MLGRRIRRMPARRLTVCSACTKAWNPDPLVGSTVWPLHTIIATRPLHICRCAALRCAVPTQVQAGVQKLTVGRPEDNCDITPVVSSSSADFITGLVEDAQAKGATFLTPYKR